MIEVGWRYLQKAVDNGVVNKFNIVSSVSNCIHHTQEHFCCFQPFWKIATMSALLAIQDGSISIYFQNVFGYKCTTFMLFVVILSFSFSFFHSSFMQCYPLGSSYLVGKVLSI